LREEEIGGQEVRWKRLSSLREKVREAEWDLVYMEGATGSL
jgi:hypothetical protein